jgi:hypothetical protein
MSDFFQPGVITTLHRFKKVNRGIIVAFSIIFGGVLLASAIAFAGEVENWTGISWEGFTKEKRKR